MQTTEPITNNEVRQLRRTLREVVALSTLPAVWAGYDPRGIAESLADVLVNALSLDLIYIRFNDPEGPKIARGQRGREPAAQAALIEEALAPFLAADPSAFPVTVPDPLGSGTLKLVRLSLGPAEADGSLIAGSARPDFPSESERLLLGIGANQAAMVIQRKRAEARTLESESRLRQMIDALPAAIYTTDAVGRLTHFNPACVAFSGRVPDLGNDNWCVTWKMFHPDGRPMPHDECPMAVTLKEGRAVLGAEAIAERPDGKRIWFAPYPIPLRDGDGRIVGGINMLVDITERKQTEAALRRSEQDLADFFDNASVGLHWVGPDGIILRANQAELDFLGYSREEYVGRPIAEFHVDQDVIAEILRRLSAGETLRDCEARMRCKDGSIKHVLIDSSVMWQNGEFIHTRCFTRDVTAKKLAEEALRESEERYRQLINLLPVGIYSCDSPSGVIAFYNRQAAELWGRAPRIGDTDERFCGSFRLWRCDGTLLPHDQTPMAFAIAEGRTFRNEDVVIERPDGSRINVLVNIDPIRDAAGQVVGAINAFHDITALKSAQEALRESEERYRSLTQAITSVIWTVDEAGRFVTPQPSWSEYTGQAWAELRDFGWANALHPDDRERVRSLWEAARAARTIYHSDGRLWHAASNSYRHFEARGVPVLNADGSVREWVGKCLDVEDRKKAEDALRKQTERMQLLWEAAAVLLTADDPDPMLRGLLAKIGPHLGVDVYFNYMVNESGDALRLASCDGIPVETARTITRLEFGQAICGTVAVNRQPMVATHIQGSDDPKAQLVKSFGIRAYACNPLMAGDVLLGTLSFASRTKDQFLPEELAFLETLTHYTTVAYERLRLLNQLKEADRRKDEFLATLAHELRNPLAPVRNAVQVLRLKGPDEPALRWSRDVIDRQVEHLTRLIDDLLDISRITRNQLELRKQRVELAEFINGAVESSRPAIEQGGHELTVTLPAQPVYLNGDLVRLTQVFLNLLNNAGKYMERGGRIWLTAERQAADVVVRVKDAGIGIPAEKLPRVFEMFFQVDRAMERSRGGLGIGLSLVRRLVELHGGGVEARSEGMGKGSEFIVRLPVLAEKPKHQQSHELGGYGEKKSIPTHRILVVDDNRDSADSLAMLLRLTGNEVHTGYDGLEGVETAERLQPDVVLLDIGMPNLNGHDACRRIREEAWGKDMVLIALTGWGQEEDRRRTVEAGFDAHMVKPVDPTALLKLLASLSVQEGQLTKR